MSLNLKSVNGVTIHPKHRASCHCGAVVLELDLPDGLVDIRRCDCSLCRRRGAIVASWFKHSFLSLTAMAEFYDLIIRSTFSR